MQKKEKNGAMVNKKGYITIINKKDKKHGQKARSLANMGAQFGDGKINL
jgi:ribosomal protein L36